MEKLRSKKCFICDMDGVIYHGNRLIPRVKEFVEWLDKEGKNFLFLTNSSERSPRELKEKLARMGLTVGEEHFYTSALATASYLKSQCPNGSVYVIGEPGLTNALYEAGFSMNDINPDYVVFGENKNARQFSICPTIKDENGKWLLGADSQTKFTLFRKVRFINSRAR